MENALMSHLGRFCKDHPFQEKILLVSSYSKGHQVLEHLARSGTPWTNLRLATIGSLAIESCQETLIKENLRLISHIESIFLLEDVFHRLSDSGGLKYFKKHAENEGIINALSSAINELRSHEVASNNLNKAAFAGPRKADDLRSILSEYEKALRDRQLVDTPGMFDLALKKGNFPRKETAPLYLILHRHYARGLERKFIEKLAGNRLTVIDEDRSIGLEPPPDTWEPGGAAKPSPQEPLSGRPSHRESGRETGASAPGTDIERLKWLYKSRQAPKPFADGTIELFRAAGHRNEVREVFRRMLASGTGVDDTEIVYTSANAYLDIISYTCEKLGIDVTFSDGLPWYFTDSGKAAMGFLRWAGDDFPARHLGILLESGWIKGDSKADFEMICRAGRLLRDSDVGWGRKRYMPVLEKEIKDCTAGIKSVEEEKDKDSLSLKRDDLKGLKEICSRLLSLVPTPLLPPPAMRGEDKRWGEGVEGNIDFTEFCRGFGEFLQKYVSAGSQEDSIFVNSLATAISQVAEAGSRKMELDEAVGKLKNIVKETRIFAGGSRPGCLHVTNYRNGGQSGRKRTFVIGLDEFQFSGRGSQDPILLDEERRKLGKDFVLSDEKAKRNIYDMACFLSGLRGMVTASYPCFDVNENRAIFPSSVVLQLFRVREGKPDADYDMLFESLGEPAQTGAKEDSPPSRNIGKRQSCAESQGSCPLDETGWWLQKIASLESMKDATEALKGIYSGIKDGLKAIEARQSTELTEYDGLIKRHDNDLDPRLNKNIILSANRIETAAECPFKYFIRYVLGIEETEEVEKDPTVWLDPMQKGILLHKVFEKFFGKAADSKMPRSGQKKILTEIFNEVLEEFKEDVPVPSDIVFQNELETLKRDLDIFLDVQDMLKTWPAHRELAFGPDEKHPVEIGLGHGRNIRVRGKIDRVDNAGPDEYHVWDYKTGSTYAFEEYDFIKGCRQVQHCLYAAAAEIILDRMSGGKRGSHPRVTKSGYLFCSEKGTAGGKGQVMPRPTNMQQVWQDALNRLLDIIGRGAFVKIPKKDLCKFCDYSDVCSWAGEQGKKEDKSVKEYEQISDCR